MRLYSTLSRRKEKLRPRPGPIRMYVCGSTVYQPVHVGNARPFVLAMWLKRWLQSNGYEVMLVHNITDVDDKIYAEARRRGLPSRRLAREATRWFFRDTNDLGLGRPDFEPRATETIPEIIEIIAHMVERGRAYVVDGDVYFSVPRALGYGQLARPRFEEMMQQEPSSKKRDPRDFALWKARKPDEDHAWKAPWGWGRPGWHIECSAMAAKYLGPKFEIHGGGIDLRFPHHENELAQAKALGWRFARTWMHNGMLELDAQKMSKSLGNVATLRSALDTWGRGPLLVYFMSGHWRKPIDFSPDALADARTTWGTLRTVDAVTAPRAAPSWDDFTRVLNDDFNTPEALAILLEWRAAGQRALLERGLDVFGLRIEVIRDRGVVLARAEVSGAAHMARPVTPQRVYQLARSYAHARSARDVQR